MKLLHLLSLPLVPLYTGESSGSASGLEKAITKSCALLCLGWTKAGPEPTHQPPAGRDRAGLGPLPAAPAHLPALGFLKQAKPWAQLGRDGAAVASRSHWFPGGGWGAQDCSRERVMDTEPGLGPSWHSQTSPCPDWCLSHWQSKANSYNLHGQGAAPRGAKPSKHIPKPQNMGWELPCSWIW